MAKDDSRLPYVETLNTPLAWTYLDYIANVGLHTGSPMFERSRQEEFSDAWKALKSVFDRDSAPDSVGADGTLTVGW